MKGKLDRYWRQFQDSRATAIELPSEYYDAFRFGTSKEGAQAISALVIEGSKTATGELKWAYEVRGKRMPEPGDLSMVLDGNDEPVCIIETTKVDVIPFDEVDDQFAYAGGEGDRTLESWRRMYWDYIVSECS